MRETITSSAITAALEAALDVRPRHRAGL